MGMTDRRLELHEQLCDILGSRYVYFMPGSDVTMHYPCIRYALSSIEPKYADNRHYWDREQYTLTLVTDDPDTELREALMNFLNDHYMYKYDRAYVAENLYHDVFVVTV